jgi:APA family basic amino acid/polyamine antiporter
VQGSLLDRVADGLLGSAAGNTMGLVSLISLAASISAMTFVGPRVYFAMARDGVFIPAAAHVHPTYATPARSIVAQSIWATVLVLTGSLDALGNYVGFAITLFAGIAVAAVFVLRQREPNAPRPFKAVGYPLTPAIFVIASIAIVVNAIITNPRVTGLGLLLILAGIPIYLWFAQRRQAEN